MNQLRSGYCSTTQTLLKWGKRKTPNCNHCGTCCTSVQSHSLTAAWRSYTNYKMNKPLHEYHAGARRMKSKVSLVGITGTWNVWSGRFVISENSCLMLNGVPVLSDVQLKEGFRNQIMTFHPWLVLLLLQKRKMFHQKMASMRSLPKNEAGLTFVRNHRAKQQARIICDNDKSSGYVCQLR